MCCTARQPPPAEITNQGDAATIAPVPAPLPADRAVTLLLKLDDKMNRQVSCELRAGDTGKALVEELVSFGLIHAVSKRDALLDRSELLDVIAFLDI